MEETPKTTPYRWVILPMSPALKAKLMVYFLEGFRDDTVVVEVNGIELLNHDHTSYVLLLGYSHTFESEIGMGPTTIKVLVPSRGFVQKRTVDVSGNVFLHVSIIGNELHLEFISPDLMNHVAFI